MSERADPRPQATLSRVSLLLLSAGLLLLVGAFASAVSSRADTNFQASPGVKFEGKRLIPASAIHQAQDVSRQKYTLRAKPGTNGKKVVRTGTSIEALAGLAHLKKGSFGYLTFPRPDGSTIYLSSDDVFDSSKEFKDDLPAIVSVKSGSTRFFRQVRQNRPQDTNAADELATPAGQSLTAAAYKGNVLGVEIKASDDKPRAGDTVDLTASYKGKTLPDEKVRFSWQFSDGGTANGESVSHTYSEAGEFQVIATATGTRTSGGQGSATITVGKAKPADNGTGTGTGTGNDGTGGYDPGTGYNYDPGTYDPGLYDPGYTSPGVPPPPSPTPPPTPDTPKTPPGPKTPSQDSPLAPGLETVSGTLVTNASDNAGAPSSSGSSQPAPDSQPAAPIVADFEDNTKPASLTLPLTGLGVALLFAGGAGRELLRSRRRAL